jgi:hypothetical protein
MKQCGCLIARVNWFFFEWGSCKLYTCRDYKAIVHVLLDSNLLPVRPEGPQPRRRLPTAAVAHLRRWWRPVSVSHNPRGLSVPPPSSLVGRGALVPVGKGNRSLKSIRE